MISRRARMEHAALLALFDPRTWAARRPHRHRHHHTPDQAQGGQRIMSTDSTYLAELRATEEAARGKFAEPMACGTCRGRVENGQTVEHDECAERATLLEAADHPSYELITQLTEDELAALPPRFHIPVFDDTSQPNLWHCAVCWGDGWVTQWPCATAQKHGTKVFTPQYNAQRRHELTIEALVDARAQVDSLKALLKKAAS